MLSYLIVKYIRNTIFFINMKYFSALFFSIFHPRGIDYYGKSRKYLNRRAKLQECEGNNSRHFTLFTAVYSFAIQYNTNTIMLIFFFRSLDLHCISVLLRQNMLYLNLSLSFSLSSLLLLMGMPLPLWIVYLRTPLVSAKESDPK